MKRTTRTHVIVNGGLGNQLFELAAGLQIAGNNSVLVECSIGYPRLGSSGKTPLEEFAFPASIRFSYRHRWSLLSKACNLTLRQGLASKKNLISKITCYLTSLLLSLYFKRRTRIVVNEGVGWSQGRESQGQSVAIIGYFQSYKTQNNEILNLIRASMSSVRGRELDELRSLAKVETPLVVHVRLSDYLNEPDFGIPGKNYYFDAIRQIHNEERHRSIWLFSDQIDLAKERIPPELLEKTRLIADVDGNDHSTLIAMALGQDFVIANSTFSWWAARLSSNPTARVIFPSPWFKALSEPKDLIPPKWEPKPAGFE